jgi:hypothetical protein
MVLSRWPCYTGMTYPGTLYSPGTGYTLQSTEIPLGGHNNQNIEVGLGTKGYFTWSDWSELWDKRTLRH